MKHLHILLFAVMCCFTLSTAQAQTRYLDEVFTSVTVDTNVVYGANATVLFFAQFNSAIQVPLYMDVYRPEGDTETNRPLILYYHTGSFLPYVNPATGATNANGSCGGTRRDSAAVEICTRLAKMGYVVASCDYRQGWNPTSTDELVRKETLINAAYRGVQDARTSVRYFRRAYAEQANAWGIDTSKIALWGQGTGGYLSMNTVALDQYVKIPLTPNNKFMKETAPGSGTFIPMVIESVHGNVEGTTWGIVPGNSDTLCYPNHVGFSSDFDLCINMAGALGDSSWLDAGQQPIISFQTTTDVYAPYAEGFVVVPGVNFNVVEAQGSYIVGGMSDDFGNNDVFTATPFFDELAPAQAAAFAASPTTPENLTTPRSALYPFNIVDPTKTAPWEWAANTPIGTALGCNFDKSAAMAYIDTIMMFYAPRGCLALELTDCVTKIVSNKDVYSATELGVQVVPNPATEVTTVSVNAAYNIQHMRLIDMTGKTINSKFDINGSSVKLFRGDLPAGTYFVQLVFEKGTFTTPVQFR